MRNDFSGVGCFRDGQYVTVNGLNGKAVGWGFARLGKAVAVRITAKVPGKHGKTFLFRPGQVKARKGGAGSGPLPRLTNTKKG